MTDVTAGRAGGGTPLALDSVVLRAVLVLSTSMLVVAIVVLTVAGASWLDANPTRQWDAAAFVPVRGAATTDGARMVIRAPDDAGAFVAALPTVSLQAAGFSRIELAVRGLSPEQKVAVFWRKRVSAETLNRPADFAEGGVVRANVGRDPRWNGEIAGLGFIVVGPMRNPVIVDSVRAVTNSAWGLAADTVADWLGFEAWSGQSINVVYLGANRQPLSLPLFVAMSTAVAILLWLALPAVRRDARARWLGALAIAAVAWIVLDARWIANEVAQGVATAERYGGKSWRDKRLAAEDRDLYAFVERAGAEIARQPGRVFFTSDFAYVRMRAGYHFLPANVLSIVYHRNLHEPPVYRPGDYLVFYARGGVRYDEASQQLSWDGKAPVKAVRVLADPLGAVFRVIA